MTATDELRRMLDERGVEYKTIGERCVEYANVQIIEYGDSTSGVLVAISHVSPEQAIEATLGRGECEYVVKDNMNESEGTGDVWFECSACHAQFDYYSDDWLMGTNYCPNCGRKVKR